MPQLQTSILYQLQYNKECQEQMGQSNEIQTYETTTTGAVNPDRSVRSPINNLKYSHK